MHRLSYKFLLTLTVIASLAGLITLIPSAGATYPSVLGYKSFCTFTPAATFYCFFIAGISCFIRSTFIKDQSGTKSERLNRHSPAFIPLTLVLILAIGATIWFTNVKAEYPDTSSSASIMEETK
ncbi:MAG: hypothetical protein JEY99_03870 [Spirochaetales bacterium]|nr:hypothetical protein [Spirochaetales bacterium]